MVAYTAPAVAASLGASTAGVQWFLASYSLTFGLGLVPAGRLGDAFGRRGLFVGGLAVFVVGGVAAASAPGVVLLVAGRLLQGLGAGVLSAQVLGIVQDAFSGTARVQALGAYSAAGALAAIVGPVVGGALLWLMPPDPGWRWVLLTPVPFAVVAAVLGLRALPRGGGSGIRHGLDLPGILLLGALVVIVTLPVIDPGMPPERVIAVAVAAAVLVGALVVVERRYGRRGRVPLFAPALLRSRGFVAGNVVALLWFGSLLAFSTVITIFFLYTQGIPAVVIALSLVPTALARLIASRLSSRLYERWGSSMIALGLAVEVLALALIVGATFVWDSWALLIATAALNVLLGASGGVIEPPLRAVTLSFAPSTLHGVAASFLQLTQRLSATFFVALSTGLLLGLGGGVSRDGLRAGIVVSAVACALALAVALGPLWRRRSASASSADAAGPHPPADEAPCEASPTSASPTIRAT